MSDRLQTSISPPKIVQRNAWTVWFTGLPGAGKSTLAAALAGHLDRLAMAHEVLDGDEMRRELCHDLGFSKQDRDENVRRIGFIAQLLNRHGVIVIVAAVSPYRKARQQVRASCSRFVEVHVDCSVVTLADRDPKGLYKRALAGELCHFSGVSDPYEAPLDPEIYINSETQSPEESIELILIGLQALHCLPRSNKPQINKAVGIAH